MRSKKSVFSNYEKHLEEIQNDIKNRIEIVKEKLRKYDNYINIVYDILDELRRKIQNPELIEDENIKPAAIIKWYLQDMEVLSKLIDTRIRHEEQLRNYYNDLFNMMYKYKEQVLKEMKINKDIDNDISQTLQILEEQIRNNKQNVLNNIQDDDFEKYKL